ncbi:LysE family translocator [Pandoraea apista]|uniref:LysE family translocator n=1 Tax=Pandoraea apista TaxID=93218 RepID=A0A5E5P6U2_9BURK|nr:LysE family translocator [Pandoraea apista]AJE97137.1 lysine transporter LysE [Pandoraea apista]AKH71091.1 lysine transporter LysE [Pandoraea apista]AKI63362.1 lysine transporter LysE [Pandoraea apista]AVF41732.1 LysE family translocator [Pandoraea apista]OXS93593.1 lysine transporter LysE [Pandoraea apista]
MPTFATLATFVVVVLGLFLIPGPAVLLTITRTVQGGRRAGIMTGMGIALGDLVHTLCAAVGLSAVLMTSALAFDVVKYVGAGYLIYLGVKALRERASDPQLPVAPKVSPGRAFVQAVATEVLNPKTALFFLAFMPQFVHASEGNVFAQFLVLGLVFVAMSALYTAAIALSVRPLGKFVRRFTWLLRWQGKIIGTIFIGLGLRVAMQQR